MMVDFPVNSFPWITEIDTPNQGRVKVNDNFILVEAYVNELASKLEAIQDAEEGDTLSARVSYLEGVVPEQDNTEEVEELTVRVESLEGSVSELHSWVGIGGEEEEETESLYSRITYLENALEQLLTQPVEFKTVMHGDDETYERPNAATVYWIGSADPINKETGDFWLQQDILEEEE